MNPNSSSNNSRHIAIIGGGFTGLAAAYDLTRLGYRVTVLERDETVGGLAGSFLVQGTPLEKFYHHWFTNDVHVMQLIRELGSEDQVVVHPTRTGMYYNKSFFKLSTPMDVLRFTPLNLIDRIRLGLLVLRVRSVNDWMKLESMTASEWLLQLCGRQVYKVVWEPLLRGKFGHYAERVSAVWFWNKLKLRGGSRGKGAAENLAYYRGGFAALAERVAHEVRKHGGQIRTGVSVEGLRVTGARISGLNTSAGILEADAVIATPALPIVAGLVAPHTDASYVEELRRVEYLGNICLVLELDRSLSSTYWLNVNDPGFPFVGVIEHTNFEKPSTYGGRHIVYLSKYLPVDAELYQMKDPDVLSYTLGYLQRMFPEFRRDWIKDYHVWRAEYSQPVVVQHYSKLIPPMETPVSGLFLSTMAQVYPEDRGTNYAIREGRKVAELVARSLAPEPMSQPAGTAHG